MAEADAHERGIELLNSLDSFAGLRNALRDIARRRGMWAGIPIPLNGQPLTLEPKFPGKEVFDVIAENERKKSDEHQDDGFYEKLNSWYCHEKRCDIVVMRNTTTGKSEHGKHWRVHGARHILNTLGASFAIGLEQEGAAVQTLGRLIRHHAFKQYLLTGMFLETSRRSGLTYVFRKLRPTIVLTQRQGEMKILTCLCMHPIGYYQDSWAGAMCPTDDVIAHLMLMRGDEHALWKRSNHHSPLTPEAGL